MKNNDEHNYALYPRRFDAYRWYKPILVGLLFPVFLLIFVLAVQYITKIVFHASVSNTGYDDLDLFSAAGAFKNCAVTACCVPSLLLAALIVRDRPVSSYWSSMGGWRWKVFLKTLAVGLIIFGIPYIVHPMSLGKTSGIRFTPGGFVMLALFLPLQCIAEELLYRSFVMQTVGSWFKVPIIGLLVQIPLFALGHQYNIVGIISVAVSAVLYGSICMISRGIEASSALHILNNVISFFMVGFGYGSFSSEQNLSSSLFNQGLKLLFFLFILYADKKLHWFDKVKQDDVARFNLRGIKNNS